MKISVVTACYNSQATIRWTIDSFLQQHHPDKELIVIDGASTDATLDIVRGYNSPLIRLVSEPDAGVFDAMNKGLKLFIGGAVGFLNSDDTFHDADSLTVIADALENSDVAFGDLLMVSDHESKRVVREWRAGAYRKYGFQLGWQPPHPSFYMRREVVDKTGLFDLSYVAASDYDYMLRVLALGHFRVEYAPAVIADFQLGGLSTRDWRATLRGTLETLRSRRQHLGAPLIDAAIVLRLVRRVFQLRKFRVYGTR